MMCAHGSSPYLRLLCLYLEGILEEMWNSQQLQGKQSNVEHLVQHDTVTRKRSVARSFLGGSVVKTVEG